MQIEHRLSRPSRSVPSARLMIGASPRTPWFVWNFSCPYMFWDKRGGRLTGQPVGTNRVDSRTFSSRCWAFRRTHTSTDPIRLLCIRVALPLALSLPSGFTPSARLMVCVSSRAMWLAGDFSRDCMFWDEKGGGLTGQSVVPQVDTATIRTVLNKNRVDSTSFSSTRCWTFRRTHTSVDPVRLLCIRIALPWTISLPSGCMPSTRLMVGASPRALELVGEFSCDCRFWDERGGGLTDCWSLTMRIE